ncbi:MAG: hypothetical protein K0S32_3414 [Bacteroidetes bacterium]|jgi:GxxExxY protein|nr:hypothetical protein [Bacteroidota bacterium]
MENTLDDRKRKQISSQILDCCIEVHRNLGPGLMESTYEKCLLKEFSLRGINAKSQVRLPVFYKGEEVELGYKVDIIVEDEFTMELKSVDSILPVHKAQLITYLKLTNKKVGFLVNFNVSLLKYGFNRMIRSY